MEPVCCFLTCIQVFSRGWSGGLVWASLSEFSAVYCDPYSFGIVSKAEIDDFLELLTFYLSVKLLSRVLISSTWLVFWPCDDCSSPSYSCYGPMTIVIPLVTVVMCLVLVFFT